MSVEFRAAMGARNDATPAVPWELVMGLHWDPPSGDGGKRAVDLDALCVLLDADKHVLEIIHPHAPRGAGGGVVHTGDSHDGASPWDDERVFVFLHALPESVTTVAFVVCSITGETFDQVQGARCHISDRETETEWLRVELTALAGKAEHVVACLERAPGGWRWSDCGAECDACPSVRPS